jgi:flagellar basal-body rod protein FlgC
MNILPALGVTADALAAGKTRLEVIGQNIANLHTTRGPDGKVYQRRVVAFESQLRQAVEGGLGVTGPKVASVSTDPSPGPAIHNPAHPHADANGMVQMPNVSLAHEMVDLIAASRTYEANLSVVRTSRQMAQRALQLGR